MNECDPYIFRVDLPNPSLGQQPAQLNIKSAFKNLCWRYNDADETTGKQYEYEEKKQKQKQEKRNF